MIPRDLAELGINGLLCVVMVCCGTVGNGCWMIFDSISSLTNWIEGTWLDSDNGVRNKQINIPSNVTRISQAMKAESSDGIAQVVYYQAGVGSMGGITSRITGGIYAEGLAENIRAAYNFVCSNYHQGDELYFLGFSRGAFTARSIAGMIGSVGVLTKTGLPYLSEIVQDFENRWDSDYRPRYPNIPFPNKPSARNPIYQEQLDKRRLSRIGVPIKAIAVWDTVGSLGIPRIGWLEKLGIQGVQSKETKEYLFYDTSLSNCVENAFQALALDELRSSFSPTVWEKNRGNNTVRSQEVLNIFFLTIT